MRRVGLVLVVLATLVATIGPAMGASTLGEIAFLKEGPTPGFFSIHLVDADGSNERVLLVDAISGGSGCEENTAFFGPSWSPDGSQLVFSDGTLKALDVDTATVTPLAAPPPGMVVEPTWSPSGDLIATTEFNTPANVFVFSSDTGAVDPPTAAGWVVTPYFGLTWSADGSIVFGSRATEVVGFAPDGSAEATVITQPGGGSIVWPRVSPDGSMIAAFDIDPSTGSGELAVAPIAVATPGDPSSVVVGAPVQVTTNSSNEAPSTWSPDSSSLAYQRFPASGGAPEGVFVVDIASGIETQILGPDACAPSWRPFGQAGGSSDTEFAVSTGVSGPTADDPIQTEVTVPVGGSVIINETPDLGPPPEGFALAGWQVDISLTTDVPIDPAAPAVFTFALDGSLGPGPFVVFKDGVPIPDCVTAGSADPAPSCVEAQGPSGGGWEIVVNTTSASLWQFGIPLGPVCTIEGTSGDDFLFGTSGDDVICGLEGNDRIFAGGGNDVVLGGDGADLLFGGAGNDELIGGDGHDVLLGSVGDDLLDGGAGNDWLYGARGDDTLIGGPGTDRLFGGRGTNTIVD